MPSKLQIPRSFWLPSFDDRDSFADHGEERAGSIMLKLKGKDAAIMVIPSNGSLGETRPVGDIYARRLSLFGAKPDCTAEQGETHVLCSHPSPPLLNFLRENECASAFAF